MDDGRKFVGNSIHISYLMASDAGGLKALGNDL
jgi:hypothetical protein